MLLEGGKPLLIKSMIRQAPNNIYASRTTIIA